MVTFGCTRVAIGASAAAPLLEVEVAPGATEGCSRFTASGSARLTDSRQRRHQGPGREHHLINEAYTEGSFVKQGQLLFQVDPRPFQAVVDQARQAGRAQSEGQLAQSRAQLARAEAQVAVADANQHRVQLDVGRPSAPLVQAQAISQQDFDDANQNNMAAKAQVQAAPGSGGNRQGADHRTPPPPWRPPKRRCGTAPDQPPDSPTSPPLSTAFQNCAAARSAR